MEELEIPRQSGAVRGGVRSLLRLEGLMVLILASTLYAQQAASWGQFAIWFLLPDVMLLAYLVNARLGAYCYNTSHSYILPLGLLILAKVSAQPTLLHVALIWLAHIGFDRMLGFGLKYPSAFRDTHLGKIGRRHVGD